MGVNSTYTFTKRGGGGGVGGGGWGGGGGCMYLVIATPTKLLIEFL